jgi:lipoyl(octanoyl) transferase
MEWKIATGLTDYQCALAQMELRVAQIIAAQAEELVWLVEHPPLYTAGTSAMIEHLLEPNKFPVYHTGRGGQFTYHGPGQRVAYIMLNLKGRILQDIRAYVQGLEQLIINTLRHFDIDGMRKEGRIGIWVDTANGEKKIAALGIRVRKWVTYHGIAINLNPELAHFGGIVPCGISQYGVTSIAELGKNVTMNELDGALKQEFLRLWSEKM